MNHQRIYYGENEWEQLEEHIASHLGQYGLEFMDKFLELKEVAEDLKLCPADTEERQTELYERIYGND